MAQRTRLELELELPYEREARDLAQARYTSVFINMLAKHYDCPDGFTSTLTRWAAGHPAVGPANKLSYREKYLQPRLTMQDVSAMLVGPLQEALFDYASHMLQSALRDDADAKTERLMGISQAPLHRYIDRQLPPGLTPKGYGTTWWVTHKASPLFIDLIDRNGFARAVSYTNLTITTDEPLILENSVNIFDYHHIRSHIARTEPRDESGRFTDDPYYENPD